MYIHRNENMLLIDYALETSGPAKKKTRAIVSISIIVN